MGPGLKKTESWGKSSKKKERYRTTFGDLAQYAYAARTSPASKKAHSGEPECKLREGPEGRMTDRCFPLFLHHLALAGFKIYIHC